MPENYFEIVNCFHIEMCVVCMVYLAKLSTIFLNKHSYYVISKNIRDYNILHCWFSYNESENRSVLYDCGALKFLSNTTEIFRIPSHVFAFKSYIN